MEKVIAVLMILLGTQTVHGQTDSTKSALQFSGYMDLYYGYGFNKPVNNQAPSFLYNYSRFNEVNIDLAYLKASYSGEKIRTELALMAGTYPQANLAAEPELLRHIYEANIGVRLEKSLWLDAGVFDSHIGLETAVSKDCWTLSRSILGENSPYYESGVKVTYAPQGKWVFSALVLNGWQRITRVNGNTTPAFGTQVTFKPNENITLNSSTFIGNDKPDSARQMRYFHDLYGIFQLTPWWGITAAFDYGIEQKAKDNSGYNQWDGILLIFRYSINNKFAVAARAERYTDQGGVIIQINNTRGLDATGYSLNLDYAITTHALCRIEGRYLQGTEEVFMKGDNYTDNGFSLLSSIAISF